MVSVVKMKFDNLNSMMNERLTRHWAACEALALGYGGISEVARATGLSRRTIGKGIAEIQGTMPVLADELVGRVRRPGAGRPALTQTDESLVHDLEGLISDSIVAKDEAMDMGKSMISRAVLKPVITSFPDPSDGTTNSVG